jgi:hypothetical protein
MRNTFAYKDNREYPPMRHIRTILMFMAAALVFMQAPAGLARDLKLTPLHRAAYANDTIALKKWLDRGSDVNALAENDVTPLHIAANEGHTESVAMLLERGANPNARDVSRRTPLALAMARKHTEATGLLIPVTDTEKAASAPPAAGETP